MLRFPHTVLPEGPLAATQPPCEVTETTPLDVWQALTRFHPVLEPDARMVSDPCLTSLQSILKILDPQGQVCFASNARNERGFTLFFNDESLYGCLSSGIAPAKFDIGLALENLAGIKYGLSTNLENLLILQRYLGIYLLSSQLLNRVKVVSENILSAVISDENIQYFMSVLPYVFAASEWVFIVRAQKSSPYQSGSSVQQNDGIFFRLNELIKKNNYTLQEYLLLFPYLSEAQQLIVIKQQKAHYALGAKQEVLSLMAKLDAAIAVGAAQDQAEPVEPRASKEQKQMVCALERLTKKNMPTQADFLAYLRANSLAVQQAKTALTAAAPQHGQAAIQEALAGSAIGRLEESSGVTTTALLNELIGNEGVVEERKKPIIDRDSFDITFQIIVDYLIGIQNDNYQLFLALCLEKGIAEGEIKNYIDNGLYYFFKNNVTVVNKFLSFLSVTQMHAVISHPLMKKILVVHVDTLFRRAQTKAGHVIFDAIADLQYSKWANPAHCIKSLTYAVFDRQEFGAFCTTHKQAIKEIFVLLSDVKALYKVLSSETFELWIQHFQFDEITNLQNDKGVALNLLVVLQRSLSCRYSLLFLKQKKQELMQCFDPAESVQISAWDAYAETLKKQPIPMFQIISCFKSLPFSAYQDELCPASLNILFESFKSLGEISQLFNAFIWQEPKLHIWRLPPEPSPEDKKANEEKFDFLINAFLASACILTDTESAINPEVCEAIIGLLVWLKLDRFKQFLCMQNTALKNIFSVPKYFKELCTQILSDHGKELLDCKEKFNFFTCHFYLFENIIVLKERADIADVLPFFSLERQKEFCAAQASALRTLYAKYTPVTALIDLSVDYFQLVFRTIGLGHIEEKEKLLGFFFEKLPSDLIEEFFIKNIEEFCELKACDFERILCRGRVPEERKLMLLKYLFLSAPLESYEKLKWAKLLFFLPECLLNDFLEKNKAKLEDLFFKKIEDFKDLLAVLNAEIYPLPQFSDKRAQVMVAILEKMERPLFELLQAPSDFQQIIDLLIDTQKFFLVVRKIVEIAYSKFDELIVGWPPRSLRSHRSCGSNMAVNLLVFLFLKREICSYKHPVLLKLFHLEQSRLDSAYIFSYDGIKEIHAFSIQLLIDTLKLNDDSYWGVKRRIPSVFTKRYEIVFPPLILEMRKVISYKESNYIEFFKRLVRCCGPEAKTKIKCFNDFFPILEGCRPASEKDEKEESKKPPQTHHLAAARP